MRFLALLTLAACTPDPKDTGGDDTGSPAPSDTECAEAEARLGYRACVHDVPDEDTFAGITVASTSVDQLRVGKYLVPARTDARLPGVFLDVNAFPLHYDFLVNAFPDLFPGLTTTEYEGMVMYPDSREFYAGTLSLYIAGEGMFYGFTVWDDPADAATTVTEAQVQAAWEALQPRFGLAEVVWVPNSTNQQEAAAGWGDTPFGIYNPADVPYEVYTEGVGYGYVRLYTSKEFVAAEEAASFGYQDIVVIDEAPEDITRVVSGIVTGTRQGTLSHLNVRSSARGTPNCYVEAPLESLAAWKDQLVRFECGSDTWSAEAATTDEAVAWWESIRPEPVEICTPNLAERSLPNLLDVPTADADERRANLCAYGAKGSNLATLYQRIDRQYQLDGFLIPFSYYQDFVETGTWQVDLGDGVRTYTFAETLAAWHADTDFLTNAAVRQDRLDALRAAMDESPVDPDVIDTFAAEILAVFGDEEVMVRLRSSSNAEDGLDFSGAGLYESASACLADELDGDDEGPSWCDPDHEQERSITDAVQEVWGSLWKMSAWDERDWYGVDQSQVAMGVLCDTRTKDEQANIVAFSGNPSDPDDDRYLVNAQLGELEVVSADPGIFPEKILLTVDDGAVTDIERVSPSSEVDEVLTDAQLADLGAEFWTIGEVFPVDYEVPEGHDLLWDTEWKVLSDGRLIVKQIRPYLR